MPARPSSPASSTITALTGMPAPVGNQFRGPSIALVQFSPAAASIELSSLLGPRGGAPFIAATTRDSRTPLGSTPYRPAPAPSMPSIPGIGASAGSGGGGIFFTVLAVRSHLAPMVPQFDRRFLPLIGWGPPLAFVLLPDRPG